MLRTQITVLNYLHLHILNWLNFYNTKQFRPKVERLLLLLQYMTFVSANTGTTVALSSEGKVYNT